MSLEASTMLLDFSASRTLSQMNLTSLNISTSWALSLIRRKWSKVYAQSVTAIATE